MARLSKDGIDRFYDQHVWLEGRTLYIGAQHSHVTDDYSADEVSPYMAESVIKGLTVLNLKPTEPISILLNSPGGDITQGLAIYDAIKRSPCHIEIIATGQCMSSASIILQAADKRILTKNCFVMVHDGTDANEGRPVDVLAWAKFGQVINKIMYNIYAERSGKPNTYWHKKCQNDYIMTADEAVLEGLADEII